MGDFLYPSMDLQKCCICHLHFNISSIGHRCFLFKNIAPKIEQMPAQHKFSWHFFTIVFWISTTSGEMLKALLECLLALFGTNPKYLYEEIQRGIWFLICQLPKQLSSNGHGRLLCWTNVLHACWAWLEHFFSYNFCPNAYELHFHVGIVTAFIFLLLNLIGSLTVIS